MRDDKLAEPLYEREPDGAPGVFYVIKDRCLLCSLPVETAPRNITWSAQTIRRGCADCPSHCRVEHQPETWEEISQVIEATCQSCIAAIRCCGTDPEILRQFRESGGEHLCDAVTLEAM